MRRYENGRFISIRYIVLACLFCAVGILTAYLYICGYQYALFTVICITFAAGAVAAGLRKFKLLFLITVMLLALTAGAVSFFIGYRKTEAIKIGSVTADIRGRVGEFRLLDSRFDACLYDVEINSDGNWRKLKGKASISLYGNGSFEYIANGDYLKFRGVIEDVFIFKEGVDTYLYKNSINYRIDSVEGAVEIIYENRLTSRDKLRAYIKDSYYKHLDGETAGIAVALVLGDTAYIENLDAYRETGLMHLFAVSGMHVSFVILLAGTVLPKKRWLRLGVIMPLVTLYAWICGFPPSMLRAMLTAGCVLIAQTDGSDGITNLAISMILILLIKPLYLFDGGFQMSYGAMLGIVTVGTKISGKLRIRYALTGKSCYKLLFPFAYSFAASAGVLPVLTAYFGFVSIAGFLITPLIVGAVSFSFIALLICLLPFAQYLTVVPGALLQILNKTVTAIAGAGGGRVVILAFGVGIIAFYIAVMIASGYVNINKKMKTGVAAAFFALAVIVGAVADLPRKPEYLLLIRDTYTDYCVIMLDETGNMGAICNVSNVRDAEEITGIYKKYKIYSTQIFITDPTRTDISVLKQLIWEADINEVVVFGGELGITGYADFPSEKLIYALPSYNPFNVVVTAYTPKTTAYLTAEINGFRVMIYDRAFSTASYFKLFDSAIEEADIVLCFGNTSKLLPYGKLLIGACFPTEGLYSTRNMGNIEVRLLTGGITVI